ncbi:MAG: SDR family oxidoreductase [Phenylobacterium sp.]|uniref:SDR family NAD(P)-dependent oxidoreductase n=1 Tax=Phenylobacterium sp. TaxID=1871053 RepID=UPI001229D0A3|nr:SDR family oxidoreductase [Phenylobacterium sp.]TAJ72798.1 MAG: SDR family oxidoreductase [Phenylobacterium sp.]
MLHTSPTASPSKGVALVTGASAGMGAIYADRLARRGFDLILVARNSARLEALAARIALDAGRRVETLTSDLRRADHVDDIEARLRTDSRITMLVNNAGVGSATPLLQSDIGVMRGMIALNVEALTRLTYAAAPAFVARGGGTIINMASIVAIGPEILNGVYGGAKAFVVALTQSLHHELGPRGLRVQAVLPGAVGTDFWAASGTPLANLPPEIVMSPEDAVDAALAGLDLGELITLPSLPDAADWQAYEDARQALFPNLSRSQPAARFGLNRPNNAG